MIRSEDGLVALLVVFSELASVGLGFLNRLHGHHFGRIERDMRAGAPIFKLF